jgi:small subunit ribosomal protein S14
VAKQSKIAKDAQRRAVVARHADRRRELKRAAIDPHLSEQHRAQARAALQRLPRDASPTRLRNRDVIDGRPRGVLRAFGLSRIRLRDLAHAGHLPGVRTSSW